MARYKGPKDRLSRAVGFDLYGKGSKLTRINVPPGMHGNRRRKRSSSEYSRQLLEKQKVKMIYQILEKQFSGYVEKALRYKGNTGEQLLNLLEKRLDNCVYRLGFAPNRIAARQFVSHKHIFVNSRKVNIPSYQVKVGDLISLSPKAVKIPAISKQLENKDYKPPKWLERKGPSGKVVGNPSREDIIEPISEQDIVEFYSR
jgi:small subunit ribosomal protein S4